MSHSTLVGGTELGKTTDSTAFTSSNRSVRVGCDTSIILTVEYDISIESSSSQTYDTLPFFTMFFYALPDCTILSRLDESSHRHFIATLI